MRKIYLLLSLLILTIGCEKEEVPSISEDSSSVEKVAFKDLPDNIKSLFPFDHSNGVKMALAVKGFGRVQADVPVNKIINEKGRASYTLLLERSGNLKRSQSYFDNIVVAEQEDGEEQIRVIRYEPEENWYSNPEKSFRNYSGAVKFFDMEGNILGKTEIVNGKAAAKDKEKLYAVLICSYKLKNVLCVGGNYGPETCTYSYSQNCSLSSGGGGGTGGSGEPTLGGGSGSWIGDDERKRGGSSGGGGNNDSDIETVPILSKEPRVSEGMTYDVKRDSSFIKIKKINCTYEILEDNASIKQILKDFFGDDAMFDVTFVVVEDLVCDENRNITGCTTKLDDFNYQISVDKDYILNEKTPTIFLAQTLIHESIHANLFAAVVKLKKGIIPQDTNFEALYENYRVLKGWNHEFMADHYTSIMQEALKEVHPYLNDERFLNGYEDNSLWDWNGFYEYVSYRGLDNTKAGADYFINNENAINLYEYGAKSNSTKTENCSEKG